MMRFKGLLVLSAAALIAAAAAPAHAQDVTPGPGSIQVTVIPGGGTFFTEGKNQSGPSFGNYTLGGSVTYNITNWLGVEGEVGGALGITQDLNIGGAINNLKTPNTFNYTGNAVFSLPTHSAFVPYATVGIGGLTMFERPELGVDNAETFLTGNVGGGLKWYAGHWGLRADYRFVGVKSKDDAPEFFGQETRYGHRFYGGVILNVK
jgi:opacity protein-like surface antigen